MPPTNLVVVPLEELAALLKRELANTLADLQGAESRPALLDRAGLAQALQVGVSTVDRFRREGCPVIWIGDSPRFELEPCLAWLRQQSSERGAQ